MREPRELSHHDLQSIVKSIQRFLYVNHDDTGREMWDPDKEWNGGDVCEDVAHVLSLHQLVPKESLPLAGHPYCLDPIDGPAFRKQRQLLSSLASCVREHKPYRANDADQELLDGLVNLTDVIADQAHDNHGIDCLLESEPCGPHQTR